MCFSSQSKMTLVIVTTNIRQWDKVHRDIKNGVLQRWNTLTQERTQSILDDRKANLRICMDRPQQRPYCEANALAYITAFGPPDEDQSRRVTGYALQILIEHEQPIVSKNPSIRHDPTHLPGQERCGPDPETVQ